MSKATKSEREKTRGNQTLLVLYKENHKLCPDETITVALDEKKVGSIWMTRFFVRSDLADNQSHREQFPVSAADGNKSKSRDRITLSRKTIFKHTPTFYKVWPFRIIFAFECEIQPRDRKERTSISQLLRASHLFRFPSLQNRTRLMETDGKQTEWDSKDTQMNKGFHKVSELE